jgi:hypothetical protein
MTVFSSTNFATKGELKRAIAAGLPVILWSPIAGMPAITGCVQCQGPWPGSTPQRTILPRRKGEEPQLPKHPLRISSWTAYVTVKDMRVVEVR